MSNVSTKNLVVVSGYDFLLMAQEFHRRGLELIQLQGDSRCADEDTKIAYLATLKMSGDAAKVHQDLVSLEAVHKGKIVACLGVDEAIVRKLQVRGTSTPSVDTLKQHQNSNQMLPDTFDEYLVDHVSRDGVHKTLIVWKSDLRPANGVKDVSFGRSPVVVDGTIIERVREVLNAVNFQNGPSQCVVHTSKLDPKDVRVVRILPYSANDRTFRTLYHALLGGDLSHVEVATDALLTEGSSSWDKLPDRPTAFHAYGRQVHLISYSNGKVSGTPGFDVLQCLPSFCSLSTEVEVGSEIDYTTGSGVTLGKVILAHTSEVELEKDITFLEHLQYIGGLVTLETRLETLKRPSSDAFPPLVPGSAETSKPSFPFSSSGPHLVRHMSNDRPELRPMIRRQTTVDASRELVIVCDPYSTGCLIAEEIGKRGYQLMSLWSHLLTDTMKSHVPLACKDLKWYVQEDQLSGETIDATAERVMKAAHPYRIVACIAGGESGVDLADHLSERLGVRTNGTGISKRRDKQVQQDLIRDLGLRSVRQAGGSNLEEVEEFLQSETYPIVLKPTESAGSDGVKLCHNITEAREHFNVLMKSQLVNGGDCPSVLCQEFLRGKEYVIDHVSRDGVHKLSMLWVYDKRPVNGAAFVYFGCIPIPFDSPEAKILIPYVRKVLDALELKNGPSHGEVIMTADGPCLVEMNCRAHGGDGNWRPLVRAMTGTSQVEASADSYLDKSTFNALPSIPPAFKAFGQEVILVSYFRGVVESTPGFDAIRAMQSFVYLETGVKPGTAVEHTIDLFTGIGSVILMHHDPEVLKQDVNTCRQMELDNTIFTYKEPAVESTDKWVEKKGHRHVYSSSRVDMLF